MPSQVTGVQLSIVGTAPNQTLSVQIGPNGYGGLSLTGAGSIFDRTSFNANHLYGNIRLHYVVGNYGVLWSQEFIDALNARGIATTAGDFYNVGLTTNPDGSYTIAFGSAIGGVANQTITADADTLTGDTYDEGMILLNIGSFLRKAGFTDLVTPASNGVFAGMTGIQAVAAQTFVY